MLQSWAKTRFRRGFGPVRGGRGRVAIEQVDEQRPTAMRCRRARWRALGLGLRVAAVAAVVAVVRPLRQRLVQIHRLTQPLVAKRLGIRGSLAAAEGRPRAH